LTVNKNKAKIIPNGTTQPFLGFIVEKILKIEIMNGCRKQRGAIHMKKAIKLLLIGFVTWIAALVLSMLLYSLKEAGDPLFETIMPLILTTLAVLSVFYYYMDVKSCYIREGAILGVSLFAVNIFFDLFMFMWGPMKMSFMQYMNDIGFTYLIYPIVSIGFGVIISNRKTSD
jgi:hypothetical protein